MKYMVYFCTLIAFIHSMHISGSHIVKRIQIVETFENTLSVTNKFINTQGVSYVYCFGAKSQIYCREVPDQQSNVVNIITPLEKNMHNIAFRTDFRAWMYAQDKDTPENLFLIPTLAYLTHTVMVAPGTKVVPMTDATIIQ